MIYHSTRDEKLTAAPTRAVLEGIAPDGGLYVCDPGKLDFDWQGTLQKDTMSMAADILGALLPDFQDMNGLVRASYAGKFASDDLTPLVPVGERQGRARGAGLSAGEKAWRGLSSQKLSALLWLSSYASYGKFTHKKRFCQAFLSLFSSHMPALVPALVPYMPLMPVDIMLY